MQTPPPMTEWETDGPHARTKATESALTESKNLDRTWSGPGRTWPGLTRSRMASGSGRKSPTLHHQNLSGTTTLKARQPRLRRTGERGGGRAT